MRMRWITISLLILLLSAPMAVFGATLQVDSDVLIDEQKVLDENLYTSSAQMRFFAQESQDVTSLYGHGVFAGIIDGDALLLGATTEISGVVNGDVRSVGGNITVSGVVHGDILAIGGTVHFTDTARLYGDVIVIAEQATMAGSYTNTSTVIANTVEINGAVDGDIEVTSNTLHVGDGAVIRGVVTYISPTPATVADGATIIHPIEFNQTESLQDQAAVKRTLVTFLSFWRILQFITTLILAFILVHVFKVFSKDVTDYVLQSFFRSFLLGLISVIVIPLAAFFLFISVFALPLGVIVMCLYIIGLLVSTAMASVYLGVFFKNITHKGRPNEISFGSAMVALLVVTLLQFVPVVGDIIRPFVAVVAFGGIIRIVYHSVRFHGKKIRL